MTDITLLQGDCLEKIKHITDHSVDMILADPPYGKTSCGWDSIIPIRQMWRQLKRVIKKNGIIIMTACQPFASKLVISNLEAFKQSLVWDKGKGSNPLLAKKRIMQSHEDILVFCYGRMPYNPQMRKGKPYKAPRTGGNRTNRIVGATGDSEGFKQKDNSGFRYPLSVLSYSIHCGSKLHPSQKPVGLMEYLIKTYTNEGDTVLDFSMGSGTTGVACVNTNRSFLGIELDPEYFKLAKKRIKSL